MPKSIPTKLLLIFTLGFVVLIGLLRIGIGKPIQDEIRHLHAGSVFRVTSIILDRRSQEVDFKRANRVAQRTGMKISIITPSRTWASDGEPLSVDDYQFSPLSLKHRSFKERIFKHPPPKKHHKREAKLLKVEFATGLNTVIYKVTTPKATLFFEMEKIHKSFTWYFFAIASLFLLLLYFVIRHQFSPITDIKRVVHEVSQGNFKARTNIQRTDDLGQLASQVNDMAEDIDRSMESKRSLLLGISHELRTPLTRAKIVTDMLADDKSKALLLEDIAEMESIITELMEAERLSEDKPLTRQATDINALINELINGAFTAGSVMFTPLTETPFINIDPIRVKLLIKNLLKNALQHSHDSHEKPSITLDINEQYLTIHVIDKGTGMPKEALDRLTEAFYRPDQSRQRKTGGFGLGLYLCQAITNAHDGELTIQSEL